MLVAKYLTVSVINRLKQVALARAAYEKRRELARRSVKS